jgi:hypothetical protein
MMRHVCIDDSLLGSGASVSIFFLLVSGRDRRTPDGALVVLGIWVVWCFVGWAEVRGRSEERPWGFCVGGVL